MTQFIEGERLLDEALNHAKQGREEEAKRLYQQAIELHPGLLLGPELPPMPLGRKGITVADVFRAIKRGINVPPYETPDQEYFWTPEWQEAEEEADRDLLHGRFREFASLEEALAYLNSDSE